MSVEIFLDTNVFESAKFSYSSNTFVNFLQHCRDYDIKLKITDVVQHEVFKRIKSNITESFEKIDKQNLGVVASSFDMDTRISKLNFIEKLTNKLNEKFNDFLDDNEIEILNSNYDIHELTNQYFNQLSPFTGQKKHEFPDAIILLTIKKYIQDNAYKTIITISNDKSFKDFSEENNIDNFSIISDALNYLIKHPNVALANAFEKQVSAIKDEICKGIENIKDDFILYSYDSIDFVDVEDIDIVEILINDLNITNYNQIDKSILLEASVAIQFSCKAYYPDPDTIIYDKEDGKYLSFTKCISKINFTENIKADIEICFDEDFNYYIEDIELYQKEFEFQLNEKFIESTEYEENY
jgi:predicted nucleic acid-binding protein